MLRDNHVIELWRSRTILELEVATSALELDFIESICHSLVYSLVQLHADKLCLSLYIYTHSLSIYIYTCRYTYTTCTLGLGSNMWCPKRVAVPTTGTMLALIWDLTMLCWFEQAFSC